MMRVGVTSLLLILCIFCSAEWARAQRSDVEASTDVTCSGAADIVLVLDQSTSIVAKAPFYDNWFVHVLNFAKSVAGAFPIGRNLTRVGLMKFSDRVDVVFHLDRYDDRQSLQNAIGNLDIDGGNTNIAAALRSARQVMFSTSNGARPGVPKILILLTDGTDNLEESNTLTEAELTKAADIKIFTIGVTHEVDEDQLKKIASKPDYFFFASGFNLLNTVVRNLVENSCREAATLPPTIPDIPSCCSALEQIRTMLTAIAVSDQQNLEMKDKMAEVIKLGLINCGAAALE